IFDIIVRINRERGVTVLLVEQNANMALHVADYGYVLEVGHRDGRYLRAAAPKGRHQGVLSRHEGDQRTRHPPVEAEEDVAMTGAPTVHGQDTLPRLFRHVVGQRGDAVAMREKDLGVWRSVTWRQYGESARRVGLGLVALGLRPRDVVSIIAENGPEWL